MSLLELTGAYTPFANGGQGVLPHIISRVRNGDGKVLYERQRSTIGQVVALPYVAAMNDMMYATVVARHRQAGGDRRPSRWPERPARRKAPATPGSSATPRITWAGCGSATTTARA